MTVKIVTDSTCDLPAKVISQLGIQVIPFYIRVGKCDYLDGIDMSREEFYKNLPDSPEHPTTAVPSPQKFHAIYNALADERATEVLSIHISSTLSAAVNVASTAAGETTSVPVTVLDSGSLSMGTGFLVQTAAELAKQGFTVREILPRLEDQIKRTQVWALLDTLKYLRRSGRMNRVVSVIGDIMHIKPILKMHNGVSEAEKVRTRKNGMNRLITMLKEFSPFEKIAFLHSNALEEVKTLHAMVSELIPNQETWFETINPVLGAHIGTGVVGFACVTKK
jgi:DegV family protein with EDD domain